VTFFLPGLTPSAPLHPWRCGRTAGPEGSPLRSLEPAQGRGLWEKERWAASSGSCCPQQTLVPLPPQWWCSPAWPRALLILTPTRSPTSLTQGSLPVILILFLSGAVKLFHKGITFLSKIDQVIKGVESRRGKVCVAYGEFVFLSLLIQPADDKLHSSHIYRALQKVSSYLLYNIY